LKFSGIVYPPIRLSSLIRDRDAINQAYALTEDKLPYQITHVRRMVVSNGGGALHTVFPTAASRCVRWVRCISDGLGEIRCSIAAVAFETQEAILVTDKNATSSR
jgi:hypothetical protein